MQRRRLIGLIALALLGAAPLAHAHTPAAIAAAVADKGRPAADVARDADRKPAEVLTFAGVKPGDTVLEILPGGGYFTRLLSDIVGPRGHVYAGAPAGKMSEAATAIAADPAHANVSVVGLDLVSLGKLPPVDLIWTSQNYHDLHLTRVHLDVAANDKLWFGALKPGGVLMVIDHAALAGAPVVETADTLHRIDPAAARAELTAAGFVFDGASDVLRNPADAHALKVFDPAIRGKTDQFVFRFRKPK